MITNNNLKNNDLINTTNRSGMLPTKPISIVDTIACCKCDNNDSSYARSAIDITYRSSMAAAPVSFCFGAGEDIVTFSTLRPDWQNRTRLEPSTATSSFQITQNTTTQRNHWSNTIIPQDVFAAPNRFPRLCRNKAES